MTYICLQKLNNFKFLNQQKKRLQYSLHLLFESNDFKRLPSIKQQLYG